jgi:AcrR family transcriptional regulator
MGTRPTPEAIETRPLRRRDAAQTRQLLLEAARRRFARDGYAAATVREIADDVGVNVALINRYFASKEGLFEVCLAATVLELEQSAGETSLARIADAITRHSLGPSEGVPNWALLLRSSGDEHTERMRLGVLARFGERLAAAASASTASEDQRRLRAQVVLAAALGVAALRCSGLQPLASATEEEILPAVSDLVQAVLGPSTG